MKRKRKIVWINLAVLAAGLMLAEGAARILMQRNMPFSERNKANLQYTANAFFRTELTPSQTVYLAREGVLTDTVIYVIDEQGFRSCGSPSAETDSVFTVMFLGGSHVFDINTHDHIFSGGYPCQVHSWIPSGDGRREMRFLNAGIPGLDTRDFAARVHRSLADHHPDVIILISGWNDLKWIYSWTDTSDYRPDEAPQPNPFAVKMNVWDQTLGWSVIYRKFRDKYWSSKLKADRGLVESAGSVKMRGNPEAGFRQLEKNLLDFAAACRTAGAQPVFSLEGRLCADPSDAGAAAMIRLDFQPGISSFEELVTAYSRFDSVMMKVADAEHIPVLKTETSLSGKKEYFTDCVHFTAEGSAEAARLYAHVKFDSLEGSAGLR